MLALLVGMIVLSHRDEIQTRIVRKDDVAGRWERKSL